MSAINSLDLQLSDLQGDLLQLKSQIQLLEEKKRKGSILTDDEKSDLAAWRQEKLALLQKEQALLRKEHDLRQEKIAQQGKPYNPYP